MATAKDGSLVTTVYLINRLEFKNSNLKFSNLNANLTLWKFRTKALEGLEVVSDTVYQTID